MATKPSLALIPSGYKASKVYSVLPSTGVGDFDFTRSGTATRVNAQGLIETVDANTPRLNYPLVDGEVSGCPSLLLEPERRNLLPYSEDFGNSAWSKANNPVYDVNDAISPKGTLTATRVVTSSGYSGFYKFVSVVNETFYTASLFVKYISGNNRIRFSFEGTGMSESGYNIFNIEDGTVVSSISGTTANVEEYKNGWYRISIKREASSSGTGGVSIYSENNNAQEFLIWGAQLEAGNYPTSYIPTSGSPITRSAENTYASGNADTFNDSEGVLFAEVNFKKNNIAKGIGISDGTSSNRVLFWLPTSGTLRGYVFNGNGSTPIVDMRFEDFKNDLMSKLAIKYKQNDFSFWVNGIEIDTDTDGNTFADGVLNQLSFAAIGTAVDKFFGDAKELRVYNTALTDAELEDLTSWDSFSEMATAQLYTIQ